jgi:hypothetical protein
VGTSNAFMFWVFYLFLYLPCVLSLCHVIQVQPHCCICPRSKVHIWRRTYDFWSSEPGWPRSECCSPVPSIDLQMIRFHSSSWLSVVFIIVVLEVGWDIYRSSYNMSQLNSLPPSFSFIPPTPIPGIVIIVSIGHIIPFTYLCTQYWHYIHTPIPSPHLLPPPTGTNPPGRTCSGLVFSLVLFFLKRSFFLLLFKIQGVSLWHLHVYINYNPNLFIASFFLLSTLVPFLWWFEQV